MSVEQVIDRPAVITGPELWRRGDIGPCELVRGEIVPVSPTGSDHGIYEGNFYHALRAFVDEHNLGKVLVGEVGVYTRRNPDTVRGVDVLFISHSRYAQRTTPGFLDVVPELIVEIMSPYDRWSEVMTKLEEYFALGVQLVWVADPNSRSVYAYRSLTAVRRFTASESLTADEILPGFSISLANLFAQ